MYGAEFSKVVLEFYSNCWAPPYTQKSAHTHTRTHSAWVCVKSRDLGPVIPAEIGRREGKDRIPFARGDWKGEKRRREESPFR